MFALQYVSETCPLEGYEGISVRVLANPTGAQAERYNAGNFGISDCPACTKLNKDRRPTDAPRYCAKCIQARATLGQSLVEFLGTSSIEGFNFSTPEEALASFENPEIPDEILFWLLELPNAVRQRRKKEIQKKLASS